MSKDELILAAYRKAINHLDDYFEYTNESKKDRARVHDILAQLTLDLKEVIRSSGLC